MSQSRVLFAAVVMTVGWCASLAVGQVAEKKAVRLAVLGSMERVGQDQEVQGRGEAHLEAAKNEWESFQVVVVAGTENLRVVAAEMTDLVSEGGAKIGKDRIKLYREESVRVRKSTLRAELPPGLYPDPLVPFVHPQTGKPIEPKRRSQKRWGSSVTVSGHEIHALPCDIFRGQNQPIWVDIHVPKNAPAGVYRGKFLVKTGRGLSAELPVTLEVWNFALPDGPTHGNHFGHFWNIRRYFGVKPGSERFREIELRYCKALAENRLNPPIPSNLLPGVNKDGSLSITPEKHQALKKFIDEMHLTGFEIPRAPFARLRTAATTPDYKTIPPDEKEKAQRYYRQYHDYLKQNGWEKHAHVYMWDEPNLKENYEQVLVLGELVHEAAPELKCLVVEQTYKQHPSWPDIDPAVDIWCPLWSFIDRKTIQEKIARGDEVWSYTALVQRSPRYHPRYAEFKGKNPPYWHIDRPLIVYRVPTWINRQYDITGLLYWSTVTTVLQPWANPAFAHPGHYNGGGYLFYPGVPCGIDGPITSMRMKNIRDGMEDYEYFAILEKLAGKDEVVNIVNGVAPNWWDYCRDPDKLLKSRREMAKRILKKQAESKHD